MNRTQIWMEGELALSDALQQRGRLYGRGYQSPLFVTLQGRYSCFARGTIVKYGGRDEVLAELSQPVPGRAGVSPANTQ